MTFASAILLLATAVLAIVVIRWSVARAARRTSQREREMREANGLVPPPPLPLRSPEGPHLATPHGPSGAIVQKGDLYSSVFQSLADALIVIDERGVIQSFSPSAERIFGYSAPEVIGARVSILMPSPDREHHDEYIRQYVQSGWSTGRMETLLLTGDAFIIRPERETVAVRKDGTHFPARLIVSEVESGGERMFVGLISDVSERKRLERELAAQVEAQDALLKELRAAYSVIEGQKRRMQLELDVGHEIQLAMVPHRFPELAEGELWAALRSAREVGGDFYDFFTTPDERLWITVGDVSGKGVPAALLMAVTKTLLKSYASQGGSPAEVLAKVNAEISGDNDNAMFVTVFLASVDLSSGEVRYCNAGHNPPLIRRADRRLDRLARRHGPVLGALEDAAFGESIDRLAPGDLFFLFTDGVTEALDRDAHLFSEPRLHDVLLAAGPGTAHQVAAAVVSAVESFADGAEQADDITVLALHYTGARTEARLRFPLRMVNTIEALTAALPELEAAVGKCGGDVQVQRRFALAFDELVSNVVKYAYPQPGIRLIECEVAQENGAIVGVVIDDGVAFDPVALEAPDTTIALEERPIGGLGVHLVKEMFDEVRYQRRGARNVTTIVHRVER